MFTRNYYTLLGTIGQLTYVPTICKIGCASRGTDYVYARTTGSVGGSSFIPSNNLNTTERSDTLSIILFSGTTFKSLSGRRGPAGSSSSPTYYYNPLISFSDALLPEDMTNVITANNPITKLSYITGHHDISIFLDTDGKYKYSKSFIITNNNPIAVTLKSAQYTIGAEFSNDGLIWMEDYTLIWGTNFDEAVTIEPNQSAEIILNFEVDPTAIVTVEQEQTE